MCGILGGTNKQWNYHAALDSIIHRGPDSQKLVSGEDITLGFNRLAIIDLSSKANQPMYALNSQVGIVFNGEIYGFKKLREKLRIDGFQFNSESDVEVLLYAYLKWGDSFTDHIDGMFAIAIEDRRQRKLKLFRDRPGIKPLYYYFKGDDFAFASELKALTSLVKEEHLEHDFTALYDYLTHAYIPEPKTVYKNVFRLEPAHALIFDLSSRRILSNRPFWTLNVPETPANITLNDAIQEVSCLIKDAVKDQLVADVPVGFFLSGGMDSSVVAAEASRHASCISAFSIGFENPEYDELSFAKIVADAFQIKHFVRTLSCEETLGLFKNLEHWYDEPFGDTSAFPTYFVSKLAKENVTVALTGDGGDEVFGGYERYKIFADNNKNWKFFRRMRKKDLDGYVNLVEWMPAWRKEVFRQEWGISPDYDHYWYLRKYYRPQLPLLTRAQYLDFHTYLPSDILTKIDRASMAVSLEARVPLLSKSIVEFVFSLPEQVRFPGGALKGLLKEAYKDILPSQIVNRKKKGFAIPLNYLSKGCSYQHVRILEEGFGFLCPK